jgi:hypothetical protein
LYVAPSKAAISAALVREVDCEKKGSINALFTLFQKLCQALSCCTQSWRRSLTWWLWPCESSGTISRHTMSPCSLINLSMICSSTRRLRPE